MDRRRLEHLVLDLTASRFSPDPEAFSGLSDGDWAEIDRLTNLHRLGPWLHKLRGGNALIPETQRGNWAAAYRSAGMNALVQQADLSHCVKLLQSHGFAPVVLKGGVLSSHAYAEPALRPMRDVDLLLPEREVLEAYRILLANGYIMASEPKLPLEDIARLEKHMPPLFMPRGSVLELHMRLNEQNGRLEYATPSADEGGFIARSVEIAGRRAPCPEDMLAHLVLHAVYGHRLDCGPVVLTDIAMLAQWQAVDWPAFAKTAHVGGWERGAGLLLALADHYHGFAGADVWKQHLPVPDAASLEMAKGLLLQDYTRKKHARVLSTMLSGRLRTLANQASGRVDVKGKATVSIDRSGDGGKALWAFRQALDWAKAMAAPGMIRQGRQLSHFNRWLGR